MSISDNERSQSAPNQPNQPESFDYVSPHLIPYFPMEIDLNQPDRAPAGISEIITEFPDSKLVGDIFTPNRHIAVMYVGGNEGIHYVELAGDTPEDRSFLAPGETLDFSDEGSVAKCLITFSGDEKTLSVHSKNPSADYCIFTRTVWAREYVEGSAAELPEYVEDPEYRSPDGED